MPDMSMYTTHSTRSQVLTGVNSPYPIDVSVMVDQYMAATYRSSGDAALPVIPRW